MNDLVFIALYLSIPDRLYSRAYRLGLRIEHTMVALSSGSLVRRDCVAMKDFEGMCLTEYVYD